MSHKIRTVHQREDGRIPVCCSELQVSEQDQPLSMHAQPAGTALITKALLVGDQLHNKAKFLD